MTDDAQVTAMSRLDGLLPLLEADPRNQALLADAANAALDERQPEVAAELLERYAQIAPLAPQELNLAGLAAMQLKQFGRAVQIFEQLVVSGADDSAVRFNLAWSRAMEKDWRGALDPLDEKTVTDLPQAAMLEVQIMHQEGELEEAAQRARRHIITHPDHPGLMAAISVLALDIDDIDLAARCAGKAGDHPDALTTLGTLALSEDRATEALDLFQAALDRNPTAPRAWIGRGLAKLLVGQEAGAAADIDSGARMFATHLGSWIAAGWAHFINHDVAASRIRFETALEIDPTFAETHGSLAVLDLIEGRTEQARQRTETALRLDRQCYSAALARALLTAAGGDAESARTIFERAANTPVDGSGRTIAQALARLGLGTG